VVPPHFAYLKVPALNLYPTQQPDLKIDDHGRISALFWINYDVITLPGNPGVIYIDKTAIPDPAPTPATSQSALWVPQLKTEVCTEANLRPVLQQAPANLKARGLAGLLDIRSGRFSTGFVRTDTHKFFDPAAEGTYAVRCLASQERLEVDLDLNMFEIALGARRIRLQPVNGLLPVEIGNEVFEEILLDIPVHMRDASYDFELLFTLTTTAHRHIPKDHVPVAGKKVDCYGAMFEPVDLTLPT
jgi:hypothetical protein